MHPLHLNEIANLLPGIPPSRIRLHPAPGTATEADAIHVGKRDGALCELIHGVLVEKAAGFRESVIAMNLLAAVGTFVREHDLGLVAGEGGMLRIAPGEIRIPDGSFISWRQLTGRVLPTEQAWSKYPDLAIEVNSPDNTELEMNRKTREYFTAGTQLVWIADPPTQTVRVHTSTDNFVELTIADTLDGGSALPGFTMPVAEVFRIE